MPAHDRLHILSWPFHNGLRDVSVGSGAIRLAKDDDLRCGIEAEGWTIADEEIGAVDENDPKANESKGLENAVAALQNRVARVYRPVDLDSLHTDAARPNRRAAPGGTSVERLPDCIRLTEARLHTPGAAITAYAPDLDADDRTLPPARGVAQRPIQGIRSQPTSGTG